MVRRSETTHLGCRLASQTRAFFSALFRIEVWILTAFLSSIDSGQLIDLNVFDVDPRPLVEMMFEPSPEVLDIVVIFKFAGAFNVFYSVLVHSLAYLGDYHGIDTLVLVLFQEPAKVREDMSVSRWRVLTRAVIS